eukprot:TRINITY_DN4165_c0_g1_i1.p1 TRINITY_DN4165_c0_g1~~TRINITY_DN4165_c0_g1_i1.p1  ORF type:complete len:140 (-),score=47.70 TRINITY_DN4165_c0_g1_i1:198-617(-)
MVTSAKLRMTSELSGLQHIYYTYFLSSSLLSILFLWLWITSCCCCGWAVNSITKKYPPGTGTRSLENERLDVKKYLMEEKFEEDQKIKQKALTGKKEEKFPDWGVPEKQPKILDKSSSLDDNQKKGDEVPQADEPKKIK